MSEPSDGAEKTWPWTLETSGNPTRRSGDARSRLGEMFVSDLMESWAARGRTAIANLSEKKPDVYLRLVASVGLTAEKSKTGDFDDVGDEELAALIVAARAALKTADGGRGSGGGED